MRGDLIPGWAGRAEEAGFSTLGTVGRYAYPGLADTVALAAAAGTTSRIGLMSGVLLATTWPGPLLAKELAGIDGCPAAASPWAWAPASGPTTLSWTDMA